jgi:hypothetical protein
MPSITSNTTFVINGVPRALSGGFYLNGVKILESATSFVFSYNGTAYADSNGERFLEDSLNTQDIKLVSGRGLEFNGVDQTFNLGTMTVGNNSTFIFTVEKIPDVSFTSSTRYLISRDYNWAIGINSNGTVSIRWHSATTYVTFSNIVVDLSRPITLAIVFGNDGEGIHTCMYEDQVGYAQASTSVAFSIANMYLASRGNAGHFSKVIFRSAINLPEYSFTQQDLAAHLQNPERTVYLENGVLKSDILPQATLDSMAAGDGFAYLLTENESCNGYLRNLATSDSLALLDNVSSDWIAGRGNCDITYDADGVIATKSAASTFAPAIQLSGIEAFKPVVIELEIENSSNLTVYPRASDLQTMTGGGAVNLIPESNESYIKVLGSFTPDVDYLWVGLAVVGGSTGQSVKITKCRAFYLTDNYYRPVENWSSTMHTNVADHSHGIQTALLDQDSNGVPTGLTSIDVQATDFADAQTQFSNENGLSLTDNEGILELRVSYLSEITTQDGQVIQTEDGQTLEV